MPVRPSKRAATKRKPPHVADLLPCVPDIAPDDRASNFSAPPSDVSEEPIDDLLARLGKRLEYVDPQVRFAQWYADVDKHLRAGSLTDVWTDDSYDSPANLTKISPKMTKQGVKRKGDALAEVALKPKRSCPGPPVVKEEPNVERAAANKIAVSKKTITGRKATATGTPAAARKAAARLTTAIKPAMKAPTTKQAGIKPAFKPSTAAEGVADLLPKKKTTAPKLALVPPLPPPVRTRTFYARRAKAPVEPVLDLAPAVAVSSILSPPPQSPDHTTALEAAPKVTRGTGHRKASGQRR
ncbi:uncharacterized protein CcaverHIS019_0307210 [Cutaneotrichosporon cavernicola]|uniref:Uncharacterized protein n=1 Tax=Cutaneotrichosporon cavernicola TaxID=279322 RepID=A0AA48L119_9TREE|nr:uncharacterized protein CcaverHIS019_0307210 [Cutaneotrichosporon cavernicola]BEI90651.1 hypothetical protein CcaverHIS019_0307210 [Cutaneotrichosporon cavernicola]BEI98429.1 hypothetical protein CcaverHIS631_0307280 [Cutaneotrichosporon cavernicola]BEJ06202.1 hypothetical protein CcaverHIS641_0307240 [Cutaneotrichosporon cavernicola]